VVCVLTNHWSWSVQTQTMEVKLTNVGIILVLMGKMFRALLTFYRTFCIVTVSISFIFCFFLGSSEGFSSILLLLWMKVITNLLIWFLYSTFSKDEMYFYNNLGYSSTEMYCRIMLLDILIFILMASIIMIVK
jgi:hypothetical protein